LGAAALPHVLMRFYTVPNAKQARRSVVWAIGCMAVFYLATLVIGYGASALVGSDRILGSTGKENSAAPLLAFEIGGILANGQNVAFLVALAFAFAASANLSTLLYSLFWRRFNTTGTLWGMYGGLIACLVLVLFSPVVSGAPDAIFKGIDFAWFPLKNPGLVSIPFSFLCGFVGTLVGRPKADPEKQAEMEVRSMTGIGS
jgi:Na+(H+)/acetate symporter ActP